MDSKFMSYFTADKASDKQSTFDLSHHNLLSATFGGLSVTFWDKVLAKDYYKIAASTQSKGAALSSPTFTELKSNDYAFFCPNQILWKHWNDYFTNGTEFAETYGSNKNNQEISGIFKEPSIPVNYLQLIGKIAKGYACPYHIFNLRDLLIRLESDPNNFDEPQVYVRSASSITVLNGVNYVQISLSDIINAIAIDNPSLVPYLKGVQMGNQSWFFYVDSNHRIRFYQRPYFSDGTQLKDGKYAGEDSYFLASPKDANTFYKFWCGSTYLYNNSSISNNKELTFTDQTFIQDWFMFFDSVSTRPQFSDAPFYVKFENTQHHIFQSDVMLSDISFEKRLGISDNRTIHKVNFHDVDPYTYVAWVVDSTMHVRRSSAFYYKFWLNAIYVNTDHTFFGENYRFYMIGDYSNFFESSYCQCYLRQNGANEPMGAALDFDSGVSTNMSSVSPFDEVFPQYYYNNSTQKKFYYPSF